MAIDEGPRAAVIAALTVPGSKSRNELGEFATYIAEHPFAGMLFPNMAKA
jgi:hypothetical protein